MVRQKRNRVFFFWFFSLHPLRCFHYFFCSSVSLFLLSRIEIGMNSKHTNTILFMIKLLFTIRLIYFYFTNFNLNAVQCYAMRTLIIKKGMKKKQIADGETRGTSREKKKTIFVLKVFRKEQKNTN